MLLRNSLKYWFRYCAALVLVVLSVIAVIGDVSAATTYNFANPGVASGGFKPQGNRFLVSSLFEQDTSPNDTTIYYNDFGLDVSGITIKADGVNLISFDMTDMDFVYYIDEIVTSITITGTKTAAAGGGTVTATIGPFSGLTNGHFTLTGKGANLANFTNLTQLQFHVVMGNQNVACLDFASITLANEVHEVITRPTTPASVVQAYKSADSEVAINWTKGNGNSRVVFAKQGVTSGVPTLADYATYTPNANFSSATDIGGGWKCVYSGNADYALISGLTATTQYRFAVFEYNGYSGAELYLTTNPATLNQNTLGSFGTWTSGDISTLNAEDFWTWTDADRDSSGNAYVAHLFSGTGMEMRTEKWNGTAWSTFPSFTPASAGYTDFSGNSSIAVTGTDQFRLAIRGVHGTTNWGITQAKYDGTAWSFQDVDLYSSAGQDTSTPVIAVDGSGNSHILYESTDASNQYIKIASWNGSAWIKQTLSTLPSASGFVVKKDYLLLNDSSNKQHVFYLRKTSATTTDLHYWTNSSGSWVDTTLFTGNADAPYKLYGAVDGSGKLHITYTNNTFPGKVVMYLTNKSGSWVTLPLISPGLGNDMGYSAMELRINGSGDIAIPLRLRTSTTTAANNAFKVLLKQGANPWYVSTLSPLAPDYEDDGNNYTVTGATFRDDGKVVIAYANQLASRPRKLMYSMASLYGNTAPIFVGATTTLTVNQNASATDITNLLHVSDSDPSQTETWSESVAPDHGGTLSFTGATATSGTTDITPGGTITYTPANGYSGTETFTVQVNDGTATATRTITVTVAAPEINLTGNSNSIADGDATPSATDHTDFGSQSVCSGTIVRTFTIQNTGNVNLTVSSVNISGSNAADYSVTASPSSPVAAAGSTTFQTTFIPSAQGTRSATITVNNNDSNEGVYDFAIQGTGVDPEITITGNGYSITDGDATPSAMDHTDFGPASLAGGTVVRTFTIQNIGNSNLTVGSVSITGAHAADFSVTASPNSPVAAVGSTTFQVTFTPSGQGTRSATITVSNNDCDESVYDFAIQGTGTNAAPIIGGVTATTNINDNATATPFSAVTIADADSAQTQTVSVTLDAAAKGALSNLGGGGYNAGTGAYSFSGTAAAAQTALRGLIFTPAANRVAPGLAETTTFAISVNDGIAAAVTDNSTTVIATSINDAPSFTKGSNQTVNEDAGAQIVNSWAINISGGPGNESGQTVNFIVTNDNNALFGTQPAIDANGRLTYTPAANASGMTTVTVSIHDNGGTVNGGIDTSATQTFTITLTPVADTPSITPASTTPATQTSSGLVVSRNAADGAEVTYFKITNIANGTLYQNDGTTAIVTGSFITYAQANAGLKFTPSGASDGTFDLQASTGNSDAGLGGSVVTATITVGVGVASPTINEDNDSGAIAISGNTAFYKITAITGGTLYSNAGFTTPVANGNFIPTAGAVTSVYFRPTANFNVAAGFSVQGSTTSADGGLTANIATSTITVTPISDTPSVASPAINEDTDSGAIAITRNAADGAETSHYKITGITGGTPYSDSGYTTQINNGDFIASAGATTNVYFRPTANRNSSTGGNGSFTVQASKMNLDAGLGGATAASTITLTPVADTPSVASPTINEDIDSGAIAITRNAADGAETSHYKVTGITGGALYSDSGHTAQITTGSFIASGGVTTNVYFRPTANRNSTTGGNGSFIVQASSSNADAGLGGSTATSTITLTPVADTPSITPATTTPATQTSSGLVVSRNAADGAEVTYFKITNIVGGTLYQNDGATAIVAGSFITYAQANAGLKFTPGGASNGTFDLQASINNADAGLGGSVVTATITVATPPTISNSFGASTIPLNGSTTVSFTVTNPAANTISLTGLAFTDNLPAGLVVAIYNGLTGSCGGGTITATAGAGSISLSGATLATNSNCTFSVNVTGVTAGVKNNSVQITSTEAGAGNTANASITVVGPPVINKSFGAASIPLNGSTSLIFTIQNNNTTTALTGTGFSDTLPAGLVVATPNGLSGTCGGGATTAIQATNNISLSGATLAASSSCTFAVNVTGTTAGTKTNTTGNVTSTEGSAGGTASNSIDVVAPPTISNAFGVPAIALNGSTTLTFTINNSAANAVAQTDVTFSDSLPAGLVVATPNGLTNSCGGSATAVAGSGSISLSGGNIATNTNCTVVVNVTGNTTGNKNNTTGTVSSANGGTGNTSNTATLTVGTAPAITSTNGMTLTVTAAGSFQVTATGNPLPALNSTGTLPTGVTFTDNGNGTATISGTPALGTVGDHALAITAANGIGSDASQSFTLTVNKATQTITLAATATKTYGDADFGAGATVPTGLPLTYSSNNETVATVAADGLIHIVGAGEAIITASQAGDGNYNAASAQQTITVSKATLTVTADNKSRAYGAADPAFTATIAGFASGDNNSVITGTPTFTTSADASSTEGSYIINPVVAGLSAANYSFTAAPGTLAVGLASQTITFNPLPNKTYGAATFTLSATGGASGNPVTYNSSDTSVATINGATVTIVGAGTTTITADQAGTAGTYATATAQQSLTVNKATITVTATSVSREYNSVNPVLTAVYSGFVNNENGAVISGEPTVTTTATQTSPVGSYPVTATINTLTAANYNFTAVNGTLAVGIANQTITFDALAAKTYGDATFDLSANGGASGNQVTFASSNEAVATVSGVTVTITGAGSAVITASQAGNSNYASATSQQTLMVAKAPLTVTPQDASRAYGEANPALIAGYNGFVNNENATALQGAPALATSADSASAPGSYPISAAVGNLFSNNYSFSYASGTLTVGKAAAVVALGNLGQSWDGTAKNVSVSTTPGTLGVGITYNGSATAPTAAGSYTVVATVSDSNYQGTASGTLVIAKATPVVSWHTPATITAGTPLSGTQLNAIANVAGIFSYTPAAGTILSGGTHTLSVTFTPSDGNYSIVGASVNLIVAAVIAADTTAPTVDAFTIPATLTALTCPITTFTASDATGVTGYLLSESATQPATDAVWSAAAPTEFTFASQGNKTLYAFAKDAAGNISVPLPASVGITLPDTTAPTVTGFTIPATATTLSIVVTTLDAIDDNGVTVWLLSEATTASAGDSNWITTKPTDYNFASQGAKTLYAFAKDAAGNVSAPLSAGVTITLDDSVAPTVAPFTLPANASSLTVDITNLTASDTVGVTGYFISESSLPPTAEAAGWTAVAPTLFTFSSQGDKTLYVFSKDAAGNVSTPASATVTIALVDSSAPTVDSFTLPVTGSSLTLAVTSFTASDAVGVTGYLLSESAAALANDSRWTATPTNSYTFASAGAKTLYSFAKDAAGNISSPVMAGVTITLPDTTAPTVDAFAVQTTHGTLTGLITLFNASDNVAVTGYMVTESATAPDAAASGWSSTAPASYTFSTGGSKNLYAYAKDAAGNVSASATTALSVYVVLRNGNGGSSADPTVADALKALQAYLGMVTLNSDDLIRYDVAPLTSSGIPEGNGEVDYSDAFLILRRSIGIGSW